MENDPIALLLEQIFDEEEAATYIEQQQQRQPLGNSGGPVASGSGRVPNDSFESEAALDSDVPSMFSERSSDAESSSSSDDDSSPVEERDEWVEDFEATSRSLPLTGRPGLKIDNPSSMSALEYFKLLFNIQFLTEMARATNEHAKEVLRRGFGPESRLNRWKETNADEILKFLGIVFFMGNVRMNKLSNYWATKDHLVSFHLRKYMSRNRFLLILRMLYFNFNDVGLNMYEKVDTLIKYFNELMRSIIYPDKELTIDESLVLFRGRLLIRQYIKNKRHKFGIKLYVLADPNGLVHRIHMYKGSADTDVAGKGHVDKVVLKLLDDYLNAGHHVYMDNFYNSVNLAEILLNKKTYCTGTLLANRKRNPAVVTSQKLKRGGHIFRNNLKGVCVMKWKDKRDVLSLSTEHTPEMVMITNRRGRPLKKPKMIVEYNKYMKGVDRHDQMLAYYPFEHKTIRWYKRMLIHICHSMFLNSFFLYKKGTGEAVSLEAFRKMVLTEILPPPTSSAVPSGVARDTLHMPEELPRNENGVLKRRKCTRCWNQFKKRKDSGIYCADCNVGLCLPCYGPYHKENIFI